MGKTEGEPSHERVGMRQTDEEITRLNVLVEASKVRALTFKETDELQRLRSRQTLGTGPRL